MDKKVLVVGGSAIGCICAKEIAKQGFETTLFEEHSQFGKFNKCGGIVSKKGLEETGVNYKSAMLNEIKGARIFSKSGNELRVSSSETKAIVINRQKFDERCADEAVSEGAELIPNERAEKFSSSDEKRIKVSTKKNSISADFLVGADGAYSHTAKSFSFPSFRKNNLVQAYQAEFENANVPEKNEVMLFLDNENFSGFFGWAIPVSEEKVRIGFATKRMENVQNAREKLFKNKMVMEMLTEKSRISYDFYHVIPLKARAKTQIGNSVFLVGDSAGQVKSTTGGGLVFGSKCAKILANEMRDATESKRAINYEQRWRREAGKTLRMHNLLHNIYGTVPDFLADFLVLSGAKTGMGKLLERFGDMDYLLKF